MERGALIWEGKLPRFSRLREGGPGRPLTLLAIAVAILATGNAGFRLQEAEGISSAGPALILLSVWSSLSLGLWIFVKAVLRDLAVVFVADEKGLTIRTSKRQDRLERRMAWFARLSFLLSWKGGQGARWTPMVAWRDIRRVAIFRNSGEILVAGGAWDIRLRCSTEMSEQILSLIHERSGRDVVFETNA